jgi:pimeloyl-ACP methyl ester carboxylesterase
MILPFVPSFKFLAGCAINAVLMPTSRLNGVQLHWEQRGEAGSHVVFVHGSWGDHHNWDLVVPAFARSFRVTTYDRRGHSQSERPAGQGRIEEDVEDLAALIAANHLAPARVVGNSGGAIVALKFAAAHPELLAGIAVHEPPAFGLIPGHPMMPVVAQRIGAVAELLKAGDMEGGAKLFVETIAFGPGMWPQLAADMRRTFVFNAPTFLDEISEPMETALWIDLTRLAAYAGPMLITQGDQSAPFFPAIVDTIAAAVPSARRHTFHGSGHVPHLTAPEDYVEVVAAFLAADH